MKGTHVETLLQACLKDSVKDVRDWAGVLFDGGEPDVSAFNDRCFAVLYWSVLAGFVLSDKQNNTLLGVAKTADAEKYVARATVNDSPRTNRIFQELVDALEKKPAILSPVAGPALSDKIRQTSLMLSGVTQKNIIDQVKKELVKSRVIGETKQDFIRRVQDLTRRSAWHLETFWRTNISSASQAGRWKQYQHQSVQKGIVAYRYSSRKKATTRPLHRAMDGFVAVASDPIWKVIWCPNGYNCMCRVSPVFASEWEQLKKRAVNGRIVLDRDQEQAVKAAENGVAVMVAGKLTPFPDEGFRGNSLLDLM